MTDLDDVIKQLTDEVNKQLIDEVNKRSIDKKFEQAAFQNVRTYMMPYDVVRFQQEVYLLMIKRQLDCMKFDETMTEKVALEQLDACAKNTVFLARKLITELFAEESIND